MSFKDVPVDFTWDERLQLTCMRRTLYRDVMLVSVGEASSLCSASACALFLSRQSLRALGGAL